MVSLTTKHGLKCTIFVSSLDEGQNKSSTKGQSPLYHLKEGMQSGLYFLFRVFFKTLTVPHGVAKPKQFYTVFQVKISVKGGLEDHDFALSKGHGKNNNRLTMLHKQRAF